MVSFHRSNRVTDPADLIKIELHSRKRSIRLFSNDRHADPCFGIVLYVSFDYTTFGKSNGSGRLFSTVYLTGHTQVIFDENLPEERMN